MPLPLYTDVHVPAAITAGLRLRGIDVLTSQEDGSNRWTDDRLLQRSTALQRVFFSQDDDLLRLASRWLEEGIYFSGVVYAHQLSAGIGRLVQDLELVLTCMTREEMACRLFYLPLK